MKIRRIVADRKTVVSDTGWKDDDIPPRYSGVYEKTKPNRNGWRWRSVLAKSAAEEYIFLTQINEASDNWKAWLILKVGGSASIVSRFEYHGSHPGIHVHSHCDLAGREVGPQLINNLVRVPEASSRHRRQQTFRASSFWETARQHFRIEFPKGDLL